MRIVIATPLYPPDIAEPAPYVKTLAGKLAGNHQMTIVLYGRLPEEVAGVRYVCIDKQTLLPLRLLYGIRVLLREARHADVLYIENGASVELPTIIASFLIRTPIIFHIGDQSAHTLAGKNKVRRLIERLTRRRACSTIEEMPLPRPEILPFVPYPQQAFVAYETSWDKHREYLETTFNHARE